MTSLIAITADPGLQGLLLGYADQAGIHLPVYDTPTAARSACGGAELVLLGVDQAGAAARAGRQVRGQLVLVTDRELDAAAAAQARAGYVVVLPVGGAWLADRLRPVAQARLDRFRDAGFTVGYSSRRMVEHGGLRPLAWRTCPDPDRPHPFVMFSDVARGECRAGQSTTVQRSNMRALHEAFPGVFTDVVFSNVTALGAFAADLPPQAVDVLCRLATQYLVFDEQDLAALEHDEVRASWHQWVCADVARGLGNRARAVFDALSDTDRERLWCDTVTGCRAWPEHDARHVLWRLGPLTGAYAARLTAEARRRAKRHRAAHPQPVAA